MVTANGWTILAHPLFLDQFERLTAAVEAQAAKDPAGYRSTANAKLLAALNELVFTKVPADPTAPVYRQGATLGDDRKHWFRAKFGNGRFRLFFRFSTQAKIIIFAWSTTRRHCAPTARRPTPIGSSSPSWIPATRPTTGKRCSLPSAPRRQCSVWRGQSRSPSSAPPSRRRPDSAAP